jgi:Raf kinase inhibitor-like YbhB/YbcL family protein
MNGTTLRALLLVSAALSVVGCGSSANKLAINSDLTGGLYGLMVSSPAFQNNGPIPARYTADGMDVSPPLKWGKGPNLTKEFAIIVEDADAKQPGDKKGRPAIHWMVYRVPADVTELPEAASRNMTFAQGKNYEGDSGYAGPNPPPGSKPHRYYFQVFALDTEQEWPDNADRETIRSTFKGHVLSKGMLVGTYQAEE